MVALSDTEIGKVVLPDQLVLVNAVTGEPVDFGGEKPSVAKEALALQYANSINDLMPRFVGKQTWQDEDGTAHDMLVMERLYPLPIHHFELPVRQEMMKLFEEKMKELHDNQFVHGDFMRPTNYFTRGNLEWMFNNIVQTESGLRLIDAGFAIICKRDNIEMFVHILFRERNEIGYFREYYLS